MSGWQTFLTGPVAIGGAEWWALFSHFLLLSLLAIGGAITTAPDMQRYVVGTRGWLSDADFSASIALAQAAPGPNVLFVAVIGYNVGGMAGVLATMIGTLLPSTVLALQVARWQDRHADASIVRAFNGGLAPVTLGLLLATSVMLFEPAAGHWQAGLLAAGTVAWMVWHRGSPLVPIAVGAVAGAMGWLR